ncbi:hypothetical protein QBC38DRAFT_376276, partial [Podospora fimiseda]
KKLFFGFPSMKLLGFNVNKLDQFIIQERVGAIDKLKQTLEQYIGIPNVLRKFIPYFHQRSSP